MTEKKYFILNLSADWSYLTIPFGKSKEIILLSPLLYCSDLFQLPK